MSKTDFLLTSKLKCFFGVVVSLKNWSPLTLNSIICVALCCPHHIESDLCDQLNMVEVTSAAPKVKS